MLRLASEAPRVHVAIKRHLDERNRFLFELVEEDMNGESRRLKLQRSRAKTRAGGRRH